MGRKGEATSEGCWRGFALLGNSGTRQGAARPVQIDLEGVRPSAVSEYLQASNGI